MVNLVVACQWSSYLFFSGQTQAPPVSAADAITIRSERRIENRCDCAGRRFDIAA